MMRKRFVTFLALMLLCRLGAAAQDHPLEGRIWDTRTQTFVSPQAVFDRAAAARFVLLGEKHDSAIHHALQLEVLKALAARGRRPALAMEQFDSEHQSALDTARAKIPQPQSAAEADTAAETLASAGQLNRKGWRWPMYKDLIAFAAEHGWPLLAANLSRQAGREIALGQRSSGLPPAGKTQQQRMEDEIVQGHCGHRLPDERLAAIVDAQRARDARMATVLDAARTDQVVLIAGSGHVRRDRAVPLYLREPAAVLSIAFTETNAKRTAATEYDAKGYDLLWFTARTERDDPCAQPLAGSVAAPTKSSSTSQEKP